ncbi:hypothetical protein [Rhizorhabdus sp. FW153]|uniref:hypothetical protein n=1 Tax=Rhizorhabdus sp. FW153 TaxID=3400216 RepID=UPI003CF6DF4B
MRPVLNQRREEPKRIRSHPQWRQTAWLIPLISVRLPPTAECRPFSQARALAFSGGAEIGMLENETSDMADILSTGLAWMLSGRAVLPAYFTAETCAVIFRQPANANRAPRSAAAAGRAWGHDPVQPHLPTRRHCRAADRWETGGADQCAIASRHRVAAENTYAAPFVAEKLANLDSRQGADRSAAVPGQAQLPGGGEQRRPVSSGGDTAFPPLGIRSTG